MDWYSQATVAAEIVSWATEPDSEACVLPREELALVPAAEDPMVRSRAGRDTRHIQ